MSVTVEQTAQMMGALANANAVRFAGAEIKREIAAGTITLADALADLRAQPIPVWRLLCALPRVGPTKATNALAREQIGSRRRVRDLTPRQKAAVVAAFERCAT